MLPQKNPGLRFREVVLSPQLGALAATLGGWSGARVAEDQLWLKPPGAGPLLGAYGDLGILACDMDGYLLMLQESR